MLLQHTLCLTLADLLTCSRGGGRIRRIGTIGEIILLGIIEKAPDATLAELATEYAWITHMPMNASVISHTLKRLGITLKKDCFLK